MLVFFIVLLGCQLLGEVIVIAAGLPLPGPVVGMALLFLGLLVKGEVPAGLYSMAEGLLSHLSLLFVPAGVGIMLHAELIGAELLPLAASVIISTMITIVVTAWIMQALSRHGQKG
jgi:holin-like protein